MEVNTKTKMFITKYKYLTFTESDEFFHIPHLVYTCNDMVNYIICYFQ